MLTTSWCLPALVRAPAFLVPEVQGGQQLLAEVHLSGEQQGVIASDGGPLGGFQLCLQTLHSGRLDPLLVVIDVLVVDALCLLVPVLALRHVAALDLDDAHHLLPGSRVGADAGEGLHGGGPVPHVGVSAASVVGLLVALHMPGRVPKLRSHGDVIKTFVQLLILAPLLLSGSVSAYA